MFFDGRWPQATARFFDEAGFTRARWTGISADVHTDADGNATLAMDVMTPKQRSRCMSRIRGVDTKPELELRRALWRAGVRYRLRQKLPGKPDLTFRAARMVVFIDGCFWHACPEHQTHPKTNADFWKTKIGSNVARDVQVNAILSAEGWTVLRFWEHEVNTALDAVVTQICNLLQKR